MSQRPPLRAGHDNFVVMPNRRDVLTLTAFAAFAATASAAEKLQNAAKSADGAAVTHEAFGDLRVYFDGPTDQLASMTAGSLRLKPGMSPHPPHQHPEEEMLVITEGSGEVSIEGKVTKVSSGSMMYCAANNRHGIVNTGKTPLLFYYYKWMRRL
jgi:quercetin dioxygenase-like cupin family protein